MVEKFYPSTSVSIAIFDNSSKEYFGGFVF
jgi:hypothetical protein